LGQRLFGFGQGAVESDNEGVAAENDSDGFGGVAGLPVLKLHRGLGDLPGHRWIHVNHLKCLPWAAAAAAHAP
jgi:hypothetical protein